MQTETENCAWVFPFYFHICHPLKRRKSNLIQIFLWWTKVSEAVCKRDWHNMRWYLFFYVQKFQTKSCAIMTLTLHQNLPNVIVCWKQYAKRVLCPNSLKVGKKNLPTTSIEILVCAFDGHFTIPWRYGRGSEVSLYIPDIVCPKCIHTFHIHTTSNKLFLEWSQSQFQNKCSTY